MGRVMVWRPVLVLAVAVGRRRGEWRDEWGVGVGAGIGGVVRL